LSPNPVGEPVGLTLSLSSGVGAGSVLSIGFAVKLTGPSEAVCLGPSCLIPDGSFGVSVGLTGSGFLPGTGLLTVNVGFLGGGMAKDDCRFLQITG
jgi:hypothetical protein